LPLLGVVLLELSQFCPESVESLVPLILSHEVTQVFCSASEPVFLPDNISETGNLECLARVDYRRW
jgi:hypothetical protein